ncbi:oxygenase MpaB family protein [Streptomyces sp. NPDC059122]|uniref:oxygenase MpaB family protein n=1 Tax=Streptomyces sp. NPDC059122 TaxID=3346732 RepID=UPI0036CF6204
MPWTTEEQQEAQAVYREMALTHFPGDVKLGLNLGFYRTFAVPSIARVLAGTGKLTRQPRVRAKATGELMYTLIEHGLDTGEGEAAVQKLIRLHSGLAVSNEDFVYVLAAFCITPIHWIDTHSWRQTTQAEKSATHTFYSLLAERMGITDVPDSFEEFTTWMDAFEVRTFRSTAEGQSLVTATRSLLSDRMPRLLSPLANGIFTCLLGERLRNTFELPRPGLLVRGLVSAALRGRRFRMRRARTHGPSSRAAAPAA